MSAIIIFALTAALFALSVNYAGSFLRLSRPNASKNAVYECGEESTGTARQSFNPRFYLIALFFILFEAEIIFLFPWAAVFGDKETISLQGLAWQKLIFGEVFIFIFMMLAGLAYVWRKGFLEWEKKAPELPKKEYPVSLDLYEKYNQETNTRQRT